MLIFTKISSGVTSSLPSCVPSYSMDVPDGAHLDGVSGAYMDKVWLEFVIIVQREGDRDYHNCDYRHQSYLCHFISLYCVVYRSYLWPAEGV